MPCVKTRPTANLDFAACAKRTRNTQRVPGKGNSGKVAATRGSQLFLLIHGQVTGRCTMATAHANAVSFTVFLVPDTKQLTCTKTCQGGTRIQIECFCNFCSEQLLLLHEAYMRRICPQDLRTPCVFVTLFFLFLAYIFVRVVKLRV